MTLGFTADQFRFLSCADVLGLYRWNGLKFAEVTTAVFQNPALAVRRAYGMALGLHLPNAGNRGYDFSSEDRAENVRHDLVLIRRFNAVLRFQYAVFHPPETGERKMTDFFVRNLEGTGMPLVLENIRGMDPETFQSFFLLMKKTLKNRLWGICLDIPHAYLTNRDWKACYRLLSPFIRVVHLSNCRDGEDSHLPFGPDFGGELHLRSILRFIQKERFGGFLNFEILPPSLWSVAPVFNMMRRIQRDHSTDF